MLHVETWILPRLLCCTQHRCTLPPTILFAARHGLRLGNFLVTSKTSILVCSGDIYNKTRSFPKDLPIPTSLITRLPFFQDMVSLPHQKQELMTIPTANVMTLHKKGRLMAIVELRHNKEKRQDWAYPKPLLNCDFLLPARCLGKHWDHRWCSHRIKQIFLSLLCEVCSKRPGTDISGCPLQMYGEIRMN